MSAPPSVSAQQLLVSINGVIQKPVAGTGQTSEGFSVDWTDIILGDAPATGSDFFILTFKSLGVSEPADNSVTSAKIVDGTIVNVDINTSAAIAGTKISPDFGSQVIQTKASAVDTDMFKIIRQDSSSQALFSIFQDSSSGGGAGGCHLNTNNRHLMITAKSASSTTDSSGLYLKTTGELGIGTSSPNGKVDVRGQITATISGNDVGVTIAQNGTGDILNLYAGGSLAFKINSVGNPTVTSTNPVFASTNSSSNVTTTLFSNSSGEGVLQTNSGSDLIFGTGAVEKVRITSAGNVGIGTSSPTATLHVAGDTQFTTSTGVQHPFNFRNDFTPNSFRSDLLSTINVTSNNALRIGSVASSGGVTLQGNRANDSSLKVSLLLNPDGGNVGIGTTNPSSIFEVKYSDSSTSISAQVPQGLRINNTDNTLGRLSGLYFTHGGGGSANTGIFSVSKDTATASSNAGSDLAFYTKSNGQEFMTEKMRLDASGNFVIGGNGSEESFKSITLSPDHDDGAGRITFNRANTTDVSIIISMKNASSQVGRIEHDHTSAAFISGSDYRLKENDVAISDGIARLKQLRPIRFNWKSEPSRTVDGFFAHEISSIVPEAVSGEKDAVDSDGNIIIQGISKERLVPLLVAALQEAIGRIEALEAK